MNQKIDKVNGAYAPVAPVGWQNVNEYTRGIGTSDLF